MSSTLPVEVGKERRLSSRGLDDEDETDQTWEMSLAEDVGVFSEVDEGAGNLDTEYAEGSEIDIMLYHNTSSLEAGEVKKFKLPRKIVDFSTGEIRDCNGKSPFISGLIQDEMQKKAKKNAVEDYKG